MSKHHSDDCMRALARDHAATSLMLGLLLGGMTMFAAALVGILLVKHQQASTASAPLVPGPPSPGSVEIDGRPQFGGPPPPPPDVSSGPPKIGEAWQSGPGAPRGFGPPTGFGLPQGNPGDPPPPPLPEKF